MNRLCHSIHCIYFLVQVSHNICYESPPFQCNLVIRVDTTSFLAIELIVDLGQIAFLRKTRSSETISCSCGRFFIKRFKLKLHILLVNERLLLFMCLFDFLLWAHNNEVVVLHLTKSREHRDTYITVALNTVNSERLCHFYNLC